MSVSGFSLNEQGKVLSVVVGWGQTVEAKGHLSMFI